jgi:gamma-glutamyltranspeptidase/glutathione hydrolase
MFYLNPRRPNALEGRKRPRATLTPTLVMKDGRPFMAFGTQGGDAQDQWTLQFFLNHTEFGMNLQQALDAPLVHSLHFPNSFHPREGHPGRLEVQPRIAPEVIAELRERCHDVKVIGDWANGKVMCVQADQQSGTLLAAASPNGNVAYALGW